MTIGQCFSIKSAIFMKKLFIILFIVLFSNKMMIAQTSISETDKIAAWTKTWGFLKYFHPAVTHGTMNWDEIFINELDSLKKIDSKEELNTHFIGLIDKLNKQTELQWNSKDGMFVETILESLDEPSIFSDELIQVMRETALQRISGKNRFLDFAGLGYPLFIEENNYEENYYPETPYRLLALARIWSAVEFFFPFKKERITKGWNTVLKQQIPVFVNAKDTLDYYKAIGSTLYELHDSHSAIIMHTKRFNVFGDKTFPSNFSSIEGKVLVTSRRKISNSAENEDKLKFGDVVLSIDGKSTESLIDEYSLFKSGSNKASKSRWVSVDLLRGWNDIAEVEVIRDNKKITLNVKRYSDPKFEKTNGKSKKWELIDDNIGLIHLRDIDAKEFNKAFRKMKNSDAIILDYRYFAHNSINLDFLADYFSTENKRFMHYQSISKDIPGKFIENQSQSFFVGKKQKARYKGKLIILIDEYIQSAGETFVAAMKTFPNVTLVGNATSGTNGEATLITVPGGFQFRMTSAMIHYPDGSPSVGKGLQPDLLVKPTIEGIKNQKDEVLEKAIEYARNTSTN